MTLPVGTILKRREPQGDEFDRLLVVGEFDLGADSGGVEVVVTSADGFAENFTAAIDGIGRDYELDASAAAAAEPEAWEAGP